MLRERYLNIHGHNLGTFLPLRFCTSVLLSSVTAYPSRQASAQLGGVLNQGEQLQPRPWACISQHPPLWAAYVHRQDLIECWECVLNWVCAGICLAKVIAFCVSIPAHRSHRLVRPDGMFVDSG